MANIIQYFEGGRSVLRLSIIMLLLMAFHTGEVHALSDVVNKETETDSVSIEGLAEVQSKLEKSNQLIIVNKKKNQLALYESGRQVNVFNVATGASPGSTPEGVFNVSVKWECPVYYKTKIGGCMEGNPLGPRWIGLDVPGTYGYTYGIHGNNSSWSIGSYASAGCVRMYNWQVIQLFDLVKVGTPVVVTSSNDSFNVIASNHNYEIKWPKRKNGIITLQEQYQAYYGSHDKLISSGVTIEGEVELIEQNGEWYRVRVGDDSYWLHKPNYFIGKIEPASNFYILNKNSYFYEMPREEAKVRKTVSSGIYKAIGKLNGWSHLRDNMGNEGWIKSASQSEASVSEWQNQKDIPGNSKNLLLWLHDYETNINSNLIFKKILKF